MISTTLIATSEGQAKVILWLVVIIGMFMGEIEWQVGLAIIGGEQAVWTGSRSFVKRGDAVETITAKDVAEEVLARLKKEDA